MITDTKVTALTAKNSQCRVKLFKNGGTFSRRKWEIGLFELSVVHIAGLHQCLVECEGVLQAVRSVERLSFRQLEVIPHQLLVRRMYAVLDDGFGTLYGILAAQVGYALFGGQNLDGMFRMVDMRGHGHDGRDLAALLYRGA